MENHPSRATVPMKVPINVVLLLHSNFNEGKLELKGQLRVYSLLSTLIFLLHRVSSKLR